MAGRGASIELSAQISRGWTLSDRAHLDDISPDTFSALVRQAFGTRAMAFVRVARYADDERPGPSEVAAPGHTNVDIGGSWQFARRLEVHGALRNILDQEYYASPDPRFVAAPGVNGFVTIVFRY